ncbi:hypothetical protein C806_01815 [Lachnospiraceae bacterium 3-1]|nr:hypothetical protein C806_01815 [Lachnospiraceae bacterium 3-1]
MKKSETKSDKLGVHDCFIHETSFVDDDVKIGSKTKIWHFCHIQSGAEIGENCSFGQNVNVSNNVKIGNGVKVQNNVSIYEGVELEDYVFCELSMIFTNDLTPRAKYPKGHNGYKKILVKHDATLGANSTIVCGNTIGEFATIAAGAVVVRNVPAHALMAGVPAKQIGWVCDCGQVLSKKYVCPDCQRRYKMENNKLSEFLGGYKQISIMRLSFKEAA